MKLLKDAKIKKGTRVLVRADFNVPIKNGKVVDPFRITKTLPTINYLLKKGARVILISHIGDTGNESLEPVYNILRKYIPATFVPAVFGATVERALGELEPGHAVLLENLRIEKGEKKNDPKFAQALASYADIYINDAFSVSHRAHASLVGVPKYLPHYAGFQLAEEVKKLTAVHTAKHPFLFILGGNKFSTKMPLIKKFAKKADYIFIGGALLNDLLRAKGYEIGKSVYETGYDVSAILKNKNLVLPIDLVVISGAHIRTCAPYEVKAHEMIMDIGPQTIKYIASLAMISKSVLWNGPLGYYDRGFAKGSEDLMRTLAKSKAYSVIGGGDTVSLVSKLKLEKKLGFVSTGGGATLDFLAYGILPGIKALK